VNLEYVIFVLTKVQIVLYCIWQTDS